MFAGSRRRKLQVCAVGVAWAVVAACSPSTSTTTSPTTSAPPASPVAVTSPAAAVSPVASSPVAVPSAPASPVASVLPSPASSPASVPSPSAVVLAAPTGGPLQPVSVSVPTKGTAFSYLYVGKDMGIYQKYGLDLNIEQITPSNAMAALQTGELDFAATVGTASQAALRGLPVRVVAIGLNATDFSILGRQGVTSLDQVKGQVISTDAPGTTSYNIAVEILRRHGLNPGDYTPVTATDDAARSAQIISGQAVAAIMEDSTAVPLQRQGYPLLANAAEVPDPFVGLATSITNIQTRQDFLKRVVAATVESFAVMANDPTDAVPIMEQEFSLSQEDAQGIYDELQPLWSTDGRPSPAAEQYELTTDQANLQLSSAPTPDQIDDFSILDAVVGNQ